MLDWHSPIGYRYLPCALSPTPSPAQHWPFYRTIAYPPTCPPVHLSWTDRSYFLRLSSTATTATTDKGFRSGRANVGVREGTWYYEVIIGRGDGNAGTGGGAGGENGNAHVRVGWGRREANLDAPVGMDGYGYGIRDINGEKVHLSRPKPYARTFKTGDVVGCLISLPARNQAEDEAKMRRKRIGIHYKGQHYFEMDEYGVQKEMEALVDREGKVAAAAKAAAEAAKEEDKAAKGVKRKGKNQKGSDATPGPRTLPILPGSRVEFFINGESFGNAFEDVYDFAPLPPVHTQTHGSGSKPPKHEAVLHDDGTLGYYPMISCFGRGKVQCNFGPQWRYAPPSSAHARPMVERWDEFRAMELRLDIRDEEEDTKRLKAEMEEMEERRIAAEAKMAAAAARGVVAASKKAGSKKKRKGTDTPSQRDSPALGDQTPLSRMTPGLGDTKMDVDGASVASRSRAGTEEAVKKEEMEVEGDVVVKAETEEDPEEGVKWE